MRSREKNRFQIFIFDKWEYENKNNYLVIAIYN